MCSWTIASFEMFSSNFIYFAESSIRSQRSGHVDPRQNHTLEHRASRQLSFSRLRPDPLERQAVVMDSRSPEVASQCSAGLALMPVETHGRLPTTPRALSPEHNTVLESKSTTLQARKQPVEFSELERDVQDLEARAQRYQERQQRTEKVELHSSYQLEPQDQALREFGQRTSEQALSLDERVDEKVCLCCVFCSNLWSLCNEELLIVPDAACLCHTACLTFETYTLRL